MSKKICPKVKDSFIFHSDNGMDYTMVIININDYRPLDKKYALEVRDQDGNYFDDFLFVGEDFFDKCEYCGEFY